MKTVRIGIIGTGGVANYRHINELLKCENAKIVALCDIDEAALKRSAEKAGVAPEKCYADYKELIADPDVDAIEVCTPNFCHAEIAKAVLAADKPLNLEKPIAMTYEEALSIVEAENNSTAFGMTCFTYRFMARGQIRKVSCRERIDRKYCWSERGLSEKQRVLGGKTS